MADDERPGTLRPRSTVLTYTTGDGHLDPMRLATVAEEVNNLMCSGMPGASIRKIGYDGRLLTIELAE